MTLTERQIQILKSIVEEYIETATPVGSETLEKKYSLGVSPATLRNEMIKLSQAGFLTQPHTSAGRAPTPQALKFYINNLMREEALSVAEEVAVKEKVWDHRGDLRAILREAVRALAERTKALSIAASDQGDVYYSGHANLLQMPEFFDIDVARTIYSLLDQSDPIVSLFDKCISEEDIHILIGDELGYEILTPCGMVFGSFEAGDIHGHLGVIGSSRLNFARVIPTIRYFNQLISQLIE